MKSLLNHPFGSRLFAGVGTVALLTSIGLFASRPAHSVGGPVAVSVANTPLAVTASVSQPFVASILVSILAGDNFAAQNFVVPANKRFVVQTVSVTCSGQLIVGSGVQVLVTGDMNGILSAITLPTAVAMSSLIPASMSSATFYLDPGSNVQITAYRNISTGNEFEDVTVIGYLVNA